MAKNADCAKYADFAGYRDLGILRGFLAAGASVGRMRKSLVFGDGGVAAVFRIQFGRAMETDDLAWFCWQNEECPDHGKRGHENLRVCGQYVKHQRRLLYCKICKAGSRNAKERLCSPPGCPITRWSRSWPTLPQHGPFSGSGSIA